MKRSHRTQQLHRIRPAALWPQSFICVVALMSVPFWAAASPPGSKKATAATVVAVIGGQTLSETDVIAHASDQFQQQQDEYAREQRQLEFNFDQARHALLQQQLDKLLDQRALELEAKARGVSGDTVLADIKVPAVTETEVHAFYDANKARSNMSYEQLAPRIQQYLANQHNNSATRAFYEGLRAKYQIHSELQPFRVAVSADGPSRGSANAPVTIVEFGDFQCPYCKEAESTLQALLAKHTNEVRLVFRQLPLTRLHPNAMMAAQVGVCADRQGKFWPMHDAMYSDQNGLDTDGLKATAKRLGLDLDRLNACLADGATKVSIDSDVKAAQDLGIGATPYFFIDGRPINGSVPIEQFENVIADELQRLGAHVAGGPRVNDIPHS